IMSPVGQAGMKGEAERKQDTAKPAIKSVEPGVKRVSAGGGHGTEELGLGGSPRPFRGKGMISRPGRSVAGPAVGGTAWGLLRGRPGLNRQDVVLGRPLAELEFLAVVDQRQRLTVDQLVLGSLGADRDLQLPAAVTQPELQLGEPAREVRAEAEGAGARAHPAETRHE